VLIKSSGYCPDEQGQSAHRPARLHHFAILSGIGWLIDFSIFNLLVYLGLSLFVANVVGATCGVSFVFVTGRRYIFRDVRTRLSTAVFAYAIWNVVAIAAMSWAIAGLGDICTTFLLPLLSRYGQLSPDATSLLHALIPPAAKIALTPISMYANFVAMGLIVERRLHLV
jgi:putative flippase GtrA